MTTFLVIIALVLSILAISQLARVFDLSASLSKETEEIKQSHNRANALLIRIWGIAFMASMIYLLWNYSTPMPEAASIHGAEMDTLMKYNMYIIITMFFIVNGVLFYFASKYHYKPGRKAVFFAHDNKLELIWTVVPTVALAFIIIFGLITWFEITGEAGEETIKVEVTSEQYNWTVRYPGNDGEFGGQSYNLIGLENETGNANSLGLATAYVVENGIKGIDAQIEALMNQIENESHLMAESNIEAAEDEIYRLKRHKQRILDLENYPVGDTKAWEASKDDLIGKELHLIVDREVEMSFRSKDVIHSAYMPHFRAQMNTVPGMPTRFKMTPTITTKEMKEKTGDEDFEYVLLCNKICGGGHWNMKIPIIVETEAEYNAWMAEQTAFAPAAEKETAAEEAPATEEEPSEAVEEEMETAVAEN